MKKSLLAIATLSVLLTSGVSFAQVDNKEDGDITFTGKVTNAACTLETVGATVQLGSVSARQLAEKNFSSWKDSSIEFSGCNLGLAEDEQDQAAKKITLTIIGGTGVEGKEAYWANQAEAEVGVGIELRIDGKPVPSAGLSGENALTKNIVGNENPSFPVKVRMAKTADTVKAGMVSTNVSFIAQYD